jgi:hypothetical protein
MKIRKFTYHIKIYNLKLLYSLLLLSIFQSCNIINPSEQIPSYISIDKFIFKTNVSFDTDSYSITDAWVEIDGTPVGTYEIPAKFPVLYSGKHKITIRAGILLNGISATRAIYPFYVPLEDTTVNLIAGKVIKITPHTTYYKNLNFKWTENFENPNISLKKTLKSDTTISITPNTGDNYFEYGGKFLGLVKLTPAKPYFECITDTSYTLPYSNSPSFLELNYKSNNSFSVTIEILTLGGLHIEEYVTINPSDVWKKIYVNLTPVTNIYSTNATGYKIIFNHYIDVNVSQGTILLDNIKLIAGS